MAVNKAEILKLVASAATVNDLEHLRVQYLGRKGEITELLKAVGSLPQAERAAAGKTANILRRDVESAIAEKDDELTRESVARSLAQPIDVTAPGIRPRRATATR